MIITKIKYHDDTAILLNDFIEHWPITDPLSMVYYI
jgi:hypothetical protein